MIMRWSRGEQKLSKEWKGNKMKWPPIMKWLPLGRGRGGEGGGVGLLAGKLSLEMIGNPMLSLTLFTVTWIKGNGIWNISFNVEFPPTHKSKVKIKCIEALDRDQTLWLIFSVRILKQEITKLFRLYFTCKNLPPLTTNRSLRGRQVFDKNPEK